jgi:cation diffusion facilitator family transporter
MDESQSRFSHVVKIALLTNVIIVVMKMGAALFTGSSALLAEAFHSAADTSNEVLLLLGIRLSRRPPDREHPFGYGKEGYFWGFVVSVLIFGIGAGLSVLEGIYKVLRPHPLSHMGVGYWVLGVSALCDFLSWRVAFKEFKPLIKRLGFFGAIKKSKSPAIFIVLLEDTAGLFGVILAFLALSLSQIFENVIFDGLGSIGIGILLGVVAFLVSRETKSLLIGEAVSEDDLQKIKEAIKRVPEVQEVLELLTMHLGPEEVLVNVNVNFVDGLNTDQVEEAIDKVEKAIRSALPSVKQVFVEAESLGREKL